MEKVSGKEAKDRAVTFLQALFDFSFKSFITPKLITLLFAIGAIGGGICAGIMGILAIYGLFSHSAWAGLFGLVLIPIGTVLGYLLGVIIWRMWLEFVVVVFKIEENTR